MKKSSLFAALAASVAWMGLTGNPVGAQQPARPAAGPNIAVIDISKIFMNHARFKNQMEDLHREVVAIEGDFKAQAEKINKSAEGLNDFRQGTPDYRAKEEEVVKQKANLQGDMALKKKEIYQREAKIHYGIYLEIMQEVKYITDAYGIAVVLNYNSSEVKPEIPDDVLRGIRQQVVFARPELDITPMVLQRLSPATQPAVNPGPAMHPGVFTPQQR